MSCIKKYWIFPVVVPVTIFLTILLVVAISKTDKCTCTHCNCCPAKCKAPLDPCACGKCGTADCVCPKQGCSKCK